MTRKITHFIIGLAVSVFAAFIPNIAAHAASFDPTRIIDDSVFYNSSSMSVQDIQNFLNSKVPTCDTQGVIGPYYDKYGTRWNTRADFGRSVGNPPPYICLKDYTQNSMSTAQIIYSAAQQYGINPQVLLVTLQKEQGLVTDDWPWTVQYNTAMGFGCPDSGPNNSANCNSQYYGYYNQMFLGAKQFRLYANNPNNYNYIPGPGNYVQFSPNASCGGTTLNIQNQATASLYDYTPYQPNQAALNAGYGSAPPCGAYGNRNFFNYFSDWFGSTYNQITYVQVQGGSGQYIIYDGKKQALTFDGLIAWGINKLPLITMSASTLDGIPSTSTALTRLATVNGTSSMVFVDNSNYYDINSGTVAVWGGFKNTSMSYVGWPLIKFANFKGSLPFIVNKPSDPHQYVMEGGTLMTLDNPTVLRAWGGSASIDVSDTYAQNIPIGRTITHNLVSVNDNLYYLSGSQAFTVTGAVGGLFSSWQPYVIDQASLGRYSLAGNLSHLIKSSQNSSIFAIDDTKKRPITAFDVFLALRNSSSYESRVSDDAISLLPTGSSISSAILGQQNTTNYYIVNNSLSVIPQRLVAEYAAPTRATSVTPAFLALFANNNLPAQQFIKINSSAGVYFVSEGKKIPVERYDVMVLLNGQNSLTTVTDSDLASLPTTTASMTSTLTTPNLINSMIVDKNSSFQTTDQQTLRDWNVTRQTQVSQATYDWYISNTNARPLSRHIQTENGVFCNVDVVRSCAEILPIIYAWDLLNGVIHPSDTLLNYLSISRSGALSIFVSAPSGQTYSSNVFIMIDGSLHYIATPSALSNLGFTGLITRLSSTTIDRIKSDTTNGYLFKDPSGIAWVIDGGSRHRVPNDLQSNWTGASAVPMNASSYFLGMYGESPSLTKSITSTSTGTIYGMENGFMRGITTYQKYAQNWSPYSSIGPNLLNLIPIGTDY